MVTQMREIQRQLESLRRVEATPRAPVPATSYVRDEGATAGREDRTLLNEPDRRFARPDIPAVRRVENNRNYRPARAAENPGHARDQRVPMERDGNVRSIRERSPAGRGMKMKASRYNGNSAYEDYNIQFEMISELNGWDD